jgi:hypothetical protein
LPIDDQEAAGQLIPLSARNGSSVIDYHARAILRRAQIAQTPNSK